MQRYSVCEEGRGLNWQLRVIMEMCSESGYGVINGVGGRTEYLRDRIHPELELESVVGKGVPLQPAWNSSQDSNPKSLSTSLQPQSRRTQRWIGMSLSKSSAEILISVEI